MAAPVATRSTDGSYPPRASSRPYDSTSSVESDTISTRSSVPIDAAAISARYVLRRAWMTTLQLFSAFRLINATNARP